MRTSAIFATQIPGKNWRNQKLVANQDNKKYIAVDCPGGMTPQKCGCE
jgi:hypothetical protein